MLSRVQRLPVGALAAHIGDGLFPRTYARLIVGNHKVVVPQNPEERSVLNQFAPEDHKNIAMVLPRAVIRKNLGSIPGSAYWPDFDAPIDASVLVSEREALCSALDEANAIMQAGSALLSEDSIQHMQDICDRATALAQDKSISVDGLFAYKAELEALSTELSSLVAFDATLEVSLSDEEKDALEAKKTKDKEDEEEVAIPTKKVALFSKSLTDKLSASRLILAGMTNAIEGLLPPEILREMFSEDAPSYAAVVGDAEAENTITSLLARGPAVMSESGARHLRKALSGELEEEDQARRESVAAR